MKTRAPTSKLPPMLFVSLCILQASCLHATTEPDQDSRQDTAAVREARSASSSFEDAPQAEQVDREEKGIEEVEPSQPLLVYLNRRGGQYARVEPGERDDSATNRASVLGSEPGQWRRLPAYAGSEEDWQTIRGCLEESFSSYRIRWTGRDPGDEEHIELAIGGHKKDLAVRRNAKGIAPIAMDCSPVPRAIAFVFSQQLGRDPSRICQVAAHELGHVLGLEHSYGHCDEAMSYEFACSSKQFVDEELPRAEDCGRLDGEQRCHCGATQNSHRHLLEVLGAATREEAEPTAESASEDEEARPGQRRGQREGDEDG